MAEGQTADRRSPVPPAIASDRRRNVANWRQARATRNNVNRPVSRADRVDDRRAQRGDEGAVLSTDAVPHPGRIEVGQQHGCLVALVGFQRPWVVQDLSVGRLDQVVGRDPPAVVERGAPERPGLRELVDPRPTDAQYVAGLDRRQQELVHPVLLTSRQ